MATTTGRHEAPVRVTDQWLCDQLDAWVADYDTFATRVETRHYRGTLAEELAQAITDSLAKTVLLCTVRQLVENIRRRTGPVFAHRFVRPDRVDQSGVPDQCMTCGQPAYTHPGGGAS